METRLAFEPHKIKSLVPVGDTIIVSDMKFDVRITSGGILLPNDDMKSSGIRPRWAKIYGLGPDVKDPDLQIGKYILISHGRWTRGVTIEDESGSREIRRVDNNDILLVSDTEPMDETFSDKV